MSGVGERTVAEGDGVIGCGGLQGADLQSAFKAGQDAFRLGEMDSAASQFGNAFVGAEIALKMGVQKGES